MGESPEPDTPNAADVPWNEESQARSGVLAETERALDREYAAAAAMLSPFKLVAELVGRETGILARHWISTHLPAAEISDITAMAERIFGDREVAVNWLRQPNLATDNQAPVDLLGTSDGFDRIKNLLLRIEYGVLA